MGQKARVTPAPTATRATSTPTTEGRDRKASTPTTRLDATAAICPPLQPAMTPRLSSGEKR
jgi:hypothetical protein